ncbi:MAG: hypothetical protein HFG45_09610 [Oscillospiraceae bacterium]|jgi:DASS family divalent anion:Na+ symporter|nr:hypothetical protein [Oscillospiraceae bacterium]
MKQTIAAMIGILLGIAVAFLPIPGLELPAKMALGILLWAIVWWIFKILPEFVTALIMGVLFILVCGIPSKTMLAAFSESSVWLLLSSFALSLGISKSGLLKRISLYILKIFPGNFPAQALGLITVGTVIGPFIPNLSAKSAILAPLSKGISDSMGYEPNGKAAAGLFLAMLTGLRSAGPLFISASVLGYTFLGLYPAEIAGRFTMWRWFVAALPWFLLVSIANFAALMLFYKPKDPETHGKDEIDRQLEVLGPMSGAERRMLSVVLVTMLLWTTEELHGLPAHLVAIAAMCVMLGLKIVSTDTFYSGMNWGPVIYVGVLFGIAPAFEALGINDWIVGLCSPVFYRVSSAPWLLVICVGLITVLLRFVIASEFAAANITMVFLIPLSLSLGINPWVIGFTVYAVICPWFFMYQNPVYVAAYYALDGEMIGQKEAAKYCAVYLSLCLSAVVLTVPIWIYTGVFYL